MRKATIITSIVCAVIYCMLQPAFLNPLFGFLFAGIIPGTEIELPFWAMSLILFSLGYSAILWLKRDMLFIGDESAIERSRKQRARAYVMQKTATPVTIKKQVGIRHRLRRRQQIASL